MNEKRNMIEQFNFKFPCYILHHFYVSFFYFIPPSPHSPPIWLLKIYSNIPVCKLFQIDSYMKFNRYIWMFYEFSTIHMRNNCHCANFQLFIFDSFKLFFVCMCVGWSGGVYKKQLIEDEFKEWEVFSIFCLLPEIPKNKEWPIPSSFWIILNWMH